MPQTKTARSGSKRTSKRTSSNGSKARSSPNGSKARSRATAKTSGSSRSGTSKASSSGARKRSSSGAGRGAGSIRKRAQQSGAASMIEKAKGPAIAGGAALVGLAGGLALKNGKRRNGLGSIPHPKVNLSMPKPKGSAVKILGGAAKEIAKGGYKIGQLTSEVRKVREAVEAQNSEK
jgi:hypothetical protein